jgi:hypothetical protein
MSPLIATFDVSLASPLFINRPARQELRYATTIGDSDIEIVLLEVHHAMTVMDRDENILRGPLWAVPRVRVSVSPSETAEPPAIRRTLEGEHV